jgi:hypothetical protein
MNPPPNQNILPYQRNSPIYKTAALLTRVMAVNDKVSSIRNVYFDTHRYSNVISRGFTR